MVSAINSFLEDSQAVIDQVKEFRGTQFHSAKCLLSIQFSNGLFQREFVVHKQEGAFLDKDTLSQNMREMFGRIQNEVDPLFGTIKESHWLVVVKDARDTLFHKMSLNRRTGSGYDCAASGPLLVSAIDYAYQAFIQNNVADRAKPLLQNGNFV